METTFAKGMAVLDCLTRSGEPMRVVDVAEATGITKSNAHRLLRSLVDLGYARQVEDSVRYCATLKIWEAGARVLNRDPLKRAAAQVLEDLRGQVGETMGLAILDGHHILYLDRTTATTPQKLLSLPGVRVPALYPASGRVILANRPDGEQLARQMAARARSEMEVDIDALLADFETIRKRGYAVAESGWYRGINSVAAVVPHGALPYSCISIAGPSARLPAARLKSLGEMLNLAARRVASMIGEV